MLPVMFKHDVVYLLPTNFKCQAAKMSGMPTWHHVSKGALNTEDGPILSGAPAVWPKGFFDEKPNPAWIHA